MVYTDRPTRQRENDVLSEKEYSMKRSNISFDDEHSMMSGSQSRCMETMGDLTNSLSEAYHKINELTSKVQELEGERPREIEKQAVREQVKEVKEVKDEGNGGRPRASGNFLNSFFRK